MKLLIVDDHAIVRAGLRQILADSGEPFETGEAGSAQEAMNTLREGAWEMVLLDVGLPDRNGVDLLKQIKAQWPDLPVLMLSMYPEEQYAICALRSGAAGYMTKETAPDELVVALRRVRQGGRYVSQTLAEILATELDALTSDRPLHAALSDREFQVLCLIGSGKTVSEIGESLVLSVKTVSTYRARVLEKMRMKTNAELTHYVVSHGLSL